MGSDQDTREIIIRTAEDLIGTRGVCSVTTRSIASQAKVNIAALNYHFGSKEKLVELVLGEMLDGLFGDWERILRIEDMALPVRIYCLIDHTMDMITKKPGMLSSHLFDPMVDVEKRKEFADRLGGFLSKLPVDLEEQLPLQAREIKLYLGQVIFLAVSAASVPEVFRAMTDEEITSDSARSRFITALMRRFLRIELRASEIIKSDIARVRTISFRGRA